MLLRRARRLVTLTVLLGCAGATHAPISAADPLSNLIEAVNNTRSSSACLPLKRDDLVQRVADMAAQETQDYIYHRSAQVPFTDPKPALLAIGYTPSKALLLSGYGDHLSGGPPEESAIRGLILQGHFTIPDCSYTTYGVAAVRDDVKGFNVTSVVLAAP